MITTTTKVAKKIIKTGKGRNIFNDKLVDGRRSLKVWGWDTTEYLKAKRKLEKKGCVVEVVSVKHRHNRYGGIGGYVQTRLHVDEQNCFVQN